MVFNVLGNNLPENVDEYVVRLEKAMVTSHEMARSSLMSNQKLKKKHYDFRLKTFQYEVGDVVNICTTRLNIGNYYHLGKGRGNFQGPFTHLI